jgi:Xaa-Pro dipeptidase
MPILHFSDAELKSRQLAARKAMQDLKLDGLLMFRQESMYYLTGYDTSGYTMFQGMLLTADGQSALLTRPIDRIQCLTTSIVEDLRIWVDSDDANPALDLKKMLRDHGMEGKTVGLEYHAYGLTGQRSKMVEAALDGFCTLVDASDLVRVLRLVKSPEELKYVRKAGELCDQMVGISIERCRPGVSTRAIVGDMYQALISGGGDPPASRWPFGAGEMALLCRYHTGEETIAGRDQVFFEPGASYRYYHACTMYNIVVGQCSPLQRQMHQACADAIDACQDALRPGRTIGEVFDIHKRVLTDAGFAHASMSACGYTMGAMYPPTWMDWPMFWTGNPQIIDAGMVFFLHMILFDKQNGISVSLGETAIVTDKACERITHIPRGVIEV